MAEVDDIALELEHELQAGLEMNTWGEGGANGATEDEQPSNTEHNMEQVVKEEENLADAQVLRALSPDDDALSDGGEYDPSSIDLLAVPAVSTQESRPSSQTSTRKPRTVGGFIADDSDEEEYDAATSVQTPPVLLEPPVSGTPNRSTSHSPLQNSITQPDMQSSSENQVDSGAEMLSSTLHMTYQGAGAISAPLTPATPAEPLTATAPIVSAPAASAPRARLPNDTTGILEDRIKEDPRGDLDAWLTLISEHRKRSKLDDARAVYERFLKLFPQSVSFLPCPYKNSSNII